MNFDRGFVTGEMSPSSVVMDALLDGIGLVGGLLGDIVKYDERNIVS